MKHLFILYELAIIAKEKGFNEKCFTYYGFDTKIKMDFTGIGWYVNKTMTGKQCAAPLYQQIVDWFREKHKIHIEIGLGVEFEFSYALQSLTSSRFKGNPDTLKAGFCYKKYNTCLQIAIEEAFKLI